MTQNLPQLYALAKSVTPEAFAKARIRYYEAVVRAHPDQAPNLTNPGGWRDRANEVLQKTTAWVTQNPAITALGFAAGALGLFFLIKAFTKKGG